MFLFHPIHFLKILVKSQPQRSYKKSSYIKKETVCLSVGYSRASRSLSRVALIQRSSVCCAGYTLAKAILLVCAEEEKQVSRP